MWRQYFPGNILYDRVGCNEEKIAVHATEIHNNNDFPRKKDPPTILFTALSAEERLFPV